MSVAALYDIHGNLPALDAVLEEVREAGVEAIVVGGDVVPGPMPRECLERLRQLDVPVHFIHGNCERAVLAQMAAPEASAATYWGTVSGRPLSAELQHGMRWTAMQLRTEYEGVFAGWPRTFELEIAGLGRVLFCHSTPRSEVEVFTRLTEERHLLPLFDHLNVSVVVCGHTHMPFDRKVGTTRVVNPGSVGMPFGATGAFWALLGPDVRFRRTTYDVNAAAARIRATEYPQAEDTVRDLLAPPDEEKMLKLYATVELR